MIPVAEAKAIVEKYSPALPPVTIPVADALGYALAEDLYAPLDLPPFDQSNMDGYAFRFSDYASGEPLFVEGNLPAGPMNEFAIRKQQAVRIFTGAPIPLHADTVIMQEKVSLQNNRLVIDEPELTIGTHVRKKGSDISTGKPALKKCQLLNPASIGLVAAMGMLNVKVYPKPRVTLLVTGNEIRQPGESLKHGEVYDANSYLLMAAFQQFHISGINVVRVDDDLQKLVEALKKYLAESDLLLLTGGISVGDYDYALPAILENGVEKLFHKVKQKPGKPLFFGRKGSKLVFGLPGNPSSVLTGFYEYIVPALEKMCGIQNMIRKLFLPLGKAIRKKPGLTHFMKGKIENAKAFALDGQESYRLGSFAEADCLICLKEEESEFAEGEMVEVHLLTN